MYSNQPTSGLTDYGYTGQRNLDEDIGLMDYKARFYSPMLSRFIQPDSIVPNPYNPQMFNRFSYVLNSPINFNDPTGHVCSDPEDPTPSCDGSMLHKTKVGNKMIQGGTMTGAKVKAKKVNNPFAGSSAGAGSSNSPSNSGNPSIPDPSINIPIQEGYICTGLRDFSQACLYGSTDLQLIGNMNVTVSPSNEGISFGEDYLSITPISISSGPNSINIVNGDISNWSPVLSYSSNGVDYSSRIGITLNWNKIKIASESTSVLQTNYAIGSNTFGISYEINPRNLVFAGAVITFAIAAPALLPGACKIPQPAFC